MLYFDTSFLVPMLFIEPTSDRIERFLMRQAGRALAISRWTRVEFASVLAREVRVGRLAGHTAREIGREFDTIIEESYTVLTPTAEDFGRAEDYLRQYPTDALHLAIAHNHRCEAIYTLDKTLLKAGKQLGLPVSAGISMPR